MEKNDKVYLAHIRDAIQKISRYLNGFDFVGFTDDEMRVDAVVRELEIIGEATKKLSLKFRTKHKDLPWKEMAGMRDKLIHEYFGIDLEVVWTTCKDDLKALKVLLSSLKI